MTTSGLSVRVWNGTDISRREDGFVNATAMCKANGKRLHHYLANERTDDYIAALAADAGIPATGIVSVRRGGAPERQGTWVHPRLAVDLARWISPQFAVWMDGWFLESLQPAPRPTAKADAFEGNGRVDLALTLLHEAIRTIDPSGSFKPGNCDVWVRRLDPPMQSKQLRDPSLGDAQLSMVRHLRSVGS